MKFEKSVLPKVITLWPKIFHFGHINFGTTLKNRHAKLQQYFVTTFWFLTFWQLRFHITYFHVFSRCTILKRFLYTCIFTRWQPLCTIFYTICRRITIWNKLSVLFKIAYDFIKEEYLTIIIIKCLFNYTTNLRSYYLKEHTKIHDDEKPYHCKICMKFFRQIIFRRHTRRHSKDNPLKNEISTLVLESVDTPLKRQ